MKKITVFLSAAILLVTVFAVMSFKPLPPRPSANGQATLTLPYLNGTQHFSFQAKTDGSGNVTGSFETKSAGQDIRVHGNIDCLRVLPDGKTAIMTGVVTQVVGNGFPIAVGDRVWFKVQDNGEGANAAGDKFTDYYLFGGSCSNELNFLPLNTITGGNIQVKP
jgi:hypothetical protein